MRIGIGYRGEGGGTGREGKEGFCPANESQILLCSSLLSLLFFPRSLAPFSQLYHNHMESRVPLGAPLGESFDVDKLCKTVRQKRLSSLAANSETSYRDWQPAKGLSFARNVR